MNIEKQRQLEAQLKVQGLLRRAEEERRQKRISHGISELILGNFEILFNEEITAMLPDYLSGTSPQSTEDNVSQLLSRLGEAAESYDRELQERAETVLAITEEINRINTDSERQSEAQKKIHSLVKSAEAERKQNRISQRIKEFAEGHPELLGDDEIHAFLPGYLATELENPANEELLKVLERLDEAAASSDKEVHARAVMLLSLAAERILSAGHLGSVQKFSAVLRSWLISETEFVAGYEVLCRQVQDFCTLFLKSGMWQDAAALLTTLHEIQTGKLKKKNSMQSIVNRTLDAVAGPAVLAELFENIFAEQGETEDQIKRCLIGLGRQSVGYGFTLLEEMEMGDERNILVNFLTEAGRTTARFFEEKMRDEPRWDVRCEMLRILSAMRDDGVYPLIEGNLLHPDARVQREVLECIIRAGGDNMISRLTDALTHVNDSLKTIIIKKLAKIESVIVRDVLLSLLDEKISKSDFSDELLLSSIIVALRPYPDTRTLIQLRELHGFLQNQEGVRKVVHLLDDTLLILESELRHKRHLKKEEEIAEYSDDPVITRLAKKKAQEIERQVITLLEQGKAEQAAEQLYRKCVEAACDKDFATAERLRDRILGVHPGSVHLVIEAEEIIIRERESQIPSSHLELWKSLRHAIGAKEFENLYVASERECFEADEIIVKEGERDDRLYFLNSGAVSLVCTTGSAKTFLKRLKAGSVVGAEQFFSISVWTVTVQARTPVELYSLRRDALRELALRFPGIEQRLREYCEDENSIPDLLKMSGGDRRSAARHQVSAIIRTLLLDNYGSAGHKSFVGQLQDISQGGFCYTIGIGNRDNARLLLGRQVRFELQLEDDTQVEMEGVIVGIEPVEQKKELYCVHVKLLHLLSAAETSKIVEMLS